MAIRSTIVRRLTAEITPTVTPINSRWDRVKVVDTVVATSTPKRFARIKVEQ